MFEQILTREALEKDYVIDGMTLNAISRKYGITRNTIHKYMKRLGVPFRERGQDLTNKRFGRLLALRPSGADHNHKARWQCKCDCGTSLEVNAASLIRGLSTSCGCYRRDLGHKRGYRDISYSWFRRLEKNAVQRGLEFNLTIEDIWTLYEKQNGKCLLSGLPIQFYPDSNRRYLQTASVDRIDCTKGYQIENVQIVHKVINVMKTLLTDHEFICFCNLVSRTNPLDYEAAILGSSRNILRKEV